MYGKVTNTNDNFFPTKCKCWHVFTFDQWTVSTRVVDKFVRLLTVIVVWYWGLKLKVLKKLPVFKFQTLSKWLKVSNYHILIVFSHKYILKLCIYWFNRKLFLSEKSNRLVTQNSSVINKRPQGSIKKYCTEKVSIAFIFPCHFKFKKYSLKVWCSGSCYKNYFN